MKTTISMITLAATLAACASTPTNNAALDNARSRFEAAQSDSQVGRLAPEELGRARDALQTAEKAQARHVAAGTVDHLAYMTVQRVTIAQETASSRASQAVTAGAASERDRVRLAMRTNEAETAQRQLAASEDKNVRQASEAAQQNAQQNAALAAADASNLAQANALAAAGASASAAAQLAQEKHDRQAARMSDMQNQLAELNAKQTERGMVVTLGDVLFDTGRSQVRHGAYENMGKLVAFFKHNPDRTATIEGYTDDVGSDDSNQHLSERRASAVMSELVSLGVPQDRLTMTAHGETMPVADNATAAGRQMNRRVEIVFAKMSEDIASR